jgi:hypothetical protein
MWPRILDTISQCLSQITAIVSRNSIYISKSASTLTYANNSTRIRDQDYHNAFYHKFVGSFILDKHIAINTFEVLLLEF